VLKRNPILNQSPKGISKEKSQLKEKIEIIPISTTDDLGKRDTLMRKLLADFQN